MKLTKLLFCTIIISTTSLLLAIALKGRAGNPIFYQTSAERDKIVGSPFESSNSTSRFALVESIVEDRTFLFNEDKARFASPDLVIYNHKFFSIFTPGVSFLGVPLFIIGKYIGFPQLTTYLLNIVTAIFNVYLIYKISKKLGGGDYASIFAGLTFLFATNALPYALTLTQHHLSTLLVLLAILNAIGKRTFVRNLFLGSIFGAAILMDIPNAFMLIPIMLYALFKSFEIKKLNESIKINFKLAAVGFLIGLIPFLALFGWYNYKLTGSYRKIGQLIGRSDYPPKENKSIKDIKDKTLKETSSELRLIDVPFNTRKELNGFYILLLSNERGLFYYSPVVVLGIFGFLLAYRSENKDRKRIVVLASSVALTNVILYSMFGDPWGGWSFGPRYLIPAAAIFCSGIALAIDKFKQNLTFLIILIALILYSVSVNSLGALTTAQIPPKVEAQSLSSHIPYTYYYNLQIVESNFSSSLIYNLFLSNRIQAGIFVIGFIGAIFTLLVMIFLASLREKDIKTNGN